MDTSEAIALFVDNLLVTPMCKHAHNPWAVVTGHLEAKLRQALELLDEQDRIDFIADNLLGQVE